MLARRVPEDGQSQPTAPTHRRDETLDVSFHNKICWDVRPVPDARLYPSVSGCGGIDIQQRVAKGCLATCLVGSKLSLWLLSSRAMGRQGAPVPESFSKLLPRVWRILGRPLFTHQTTGCSTVRRLSQNVLISRASRPLIMMLHGRSRSRCATPSFRAFGLRSEPSTGSHQAVIMACLKAVPILIPSTLQMVIYAIRKALGMLSYIARGLPGPAGLNWPTNFSWRSGKYYKLSALV